MVIAGVRQSLSGYRHEIITVDDGSADATAGIARDSGTVVIRHENNRGKGAAMKTGVASSKGDIIVFIDSDGAHSPGDIPQLLTPVIQGRADFVIGSRALPGSSLSSPPIRRRLSNSLASFIISVIISCLLPLTTWRRKRPVKPSKPAAGSASGEYRIITGRLKWITDCTSGFRVITRDAWQQMCLISEGFEIETEMIYEAAGNKLTIAETAISCSWKSKISRLSIVRDGVRTLKLLLKKLLSKPGA